ncbi:MAG: hypothetical protein HRT89_14525 [Lentisphaeria bacterium]|nr:hypothetical protein [Lentisphaeria bacterium]
MTTDKIIMRDGDTAYEVEHNWGKLPDTIILGKTHALVNDKAGNIILAQTSCDASPNKDTILIFNSDGDLINSWGEQFYQNAHGLTLHEEDGVEYLYLVDDKNGVFKCTMEGEVLFQWGKPDIYQENEWKWGPANVLVMANCDIYLVEGYGEAYVLHFNAKGDLLHRFGGRIEGPEGTVHPSH